MKLRTDIDIITFLQTANKCNGEVYFESTEGDVLNLKSQLSRCLFLAAFSSQKDDILFHGQITYTDTADRAILLSYLTD